uniref:Uncharacterized protein n=1 Tax=mine drainage metagenome TaxID=410659 RepID=E6QK04_9ZZZZ
MSTSKTRYCILTDVWDQKTTNADVAFSAKAKERDAFREKDTGIWKSNSGSPGGLCFSAR